MKMQWYEYLKYYKKIPCYHGTNTFFKNPDFSKIGENTSDLNNVNIGFCLTNNKKYAMNYAKYRSIDGGQPIILKAYIYINNPFEITNTELEDVCIDVESAINFKNQIISEGYDSIIIYTNDGNEEYCIFDESQVHILNKPKL